MTEHIQSCGSGNMVLKTLCVLSIFICAATSAPDTRIVGGTPTTIEQFPYIVALVYHFPASGIRVQRCVGSLVSSWHVITSAYCYTGAILSNMEVRAGSTNSMSGGTVVSIQEVVKHPGYEQTPRRDDIAVAFLTTPLGITDSINILYLPVQGTYIPDGQSMKVVSWGFESMAGPQLEILKTVNLNKVPLDQCQAAYADKDGVVIGDPVICAGDEGNVGVCLGDSGAPMVIGEVLVGLSSYFQECSSDVYPNVFSRIDRYTDWILEVATPPSRNGTAIRTKPVVL